MPSTVISVAAVPAPPASRVPAQRNVTTGALPAAVPLRVRVTFVPETPSRHTSVAVPSTGAALPTVTATPPPPVARAEVCRVELVTACRTFTRSHRSSRTAATLAPV